MRVLFIVNEFAGNGKGKIVWNRLQQHLTIDYQVALTQYEGHGQEIAKQWAQNDQTKKLIIIVGGDGTVHEVVSGIVHNNLVVIAVVSAGSGNDFARYFQTFKNAKQIETYVKTEMPSTTMDIGKLQLGAIKHEVFVNNAGIGFDAYVTRQINKSRLKYYFNKIGLGKLSYAAAVVRGLFRFTCFDVTVLTQNETLHFQNVWFVATSNQPYFGGGMKISPMSKADDGKVELTIVHNISRVKLLLVFATVFFEKHTKFREISFLQSELFEIVVHANSVDCHTDGNYIGAIGQDAVVRCTVQQQAWKCITLEKSKNVISQ
ncbi:MULTISPECIES: diacylglycerol/lipid kinase family protein [unclassified Lysinibacillus]|uniref:diacylglycerol/lipid kinase family protein n=1 Tax=unclassified Lysinibacillus TaxID=2636778 RepID=UPI003809F01A